MPTIAIYSRNSRQIALKPLRSILSAIMKHGGQAILFKPFYDEVAHELNSSIVCGTFSTCADIRNDADFLISLGGDGTLLDTVTLIQNSNIPIIGINIGKLGFLSCVGSDEIETAVELLFTGNFTLTERTLLKFKYLNNYETPELNVALNDITVTKKDINTMITVHTYVNDVHVNSYWSDGLIIATPTGSTAYSLSCLGPILTPDSQNIIINPIAPHNLSVRPMIIPETSRIMLIVEGRNRTFNLTLDSRTSTVKTGTSIEISKAAFTVKLVTLPGDNFFKIIRDKLHWGTDKRN